MVLWCAAVQQRSQLAQSGRRARHRFPHAMAPLIIYDLAGARPAARARPRCAACGADRPQPGGKSESWATHASTRLPLCYPCRKARQGHANKRWSPQNVEDTVQAVASELQQRLAASPPGSAEDGSARFVAAVEAVMQRIGLAQQVEEEQARQERLQRMLRNSSVVGARAVDALVAAINREVGFACAVFRHLLSGSNGAPPTPFAPHAAGLPEPGGHPGCNSGQ